MCDVFASGQCEGEKNEVADHLAKFELNGANSKWVDSEVSRLCENDIKCTSCKVKEDRFHF